MAGKGDVDDILILVALIKRASAGGEKEVGDFGSSDRTTGGAGKAWVAGVVDVMTLSAAGPTLSIVDDYGLSSAGLERENDLGKIVAFFELEIERETGALTDANTKGVKLLV